MTHNHIIEVVGIGLDGVLGLTNQVKQIIQQATVLVGSERHLGYFPQHPGKYLVLGDLIETIVEIRRFWQDNQRIVILVSGDPLFFGLGRLLLTKFKEENLRFHPSLTSVQLAFNRVKIPWQDAKFVSIHGRSLDELITLLQQGAEKIALLTDTEHNPQAIADLYHSLDLPISYDFWVCENLGDETEKVNCFPDGDNLTSVQFSPLNVVILLRRSQTLLPEKLPLIGLKDQTFLSFSDRPGLMTKREIRMIILGELALAPKQIIWDIGAGTGSVSLEIARLCPNNQVYAIEKTAIGISLIEQNCQRLQVGNVISIHGTAPQILAQLPTPDRIFIGGSGGHLEDILGVCQQKLSVDGVIVLAIATLETLHQALQWLKSHSWQYHLLQLQISRSIPINNLTRFSPLNPVTIVTIYP